MATKVHMEALSPTMEEGQLVKWLKHEGDAVREGDVLAEIETDKATMELVARGAGVLRDVRVKEGETAPVGEVIAMIAAEGEAVDAAPSKPAEAGAASKPAEVAAASKPAEAAAASKPTAPAKAEQRQPAVRASESSGTPGATEKPREVEEEPEEISEPAAEARPRPGEERARETTGPGDGDGSRIKASPLARKMASESGVELTAVAGTGPGGRITKRDIEAAAREPAATPPARAAQPAAPAAAPSVASGVDAEQLPVSQMRKTIAKRLALSIGPIPTFYLTIECDMTRTLEVRERVNARLEKDGVKASINDFIIKAVAMALGRHPEVNASWGDTAITRHHRVHIGVAVAVEDGLITPIVRDADRKRVRDIAVEVKELAGRAREKKLKPDEYTGATFSISNLGMFGIVEFTAIINPPESGIIAVGGVEQKVVVENGEMVVRPRMRMTMSCDHRVVDGATGAKFLQTVRDMIEDPIAMIA